MKIGIVGIDQETLGVAASLAEQGNEVVCSDLNPLRLQLLQQAQLPLYELGLVKLVQRGLERGTLRVANHIHEAIEGADSVFTGPQVGWKKSGDKRLSETFCRAASSALGKHGLAALMSKAIARLLAAFKRQAARVARWWRRAAEVRGKHGLRAVLFRVIRKIGRKLFRISTVSAPPALAMVPSCAGHAVEHLLDKRDTGSHFYRGLQFRWRIPARQSPGLQKDRGNLLFFTHDLSFSGAPLNMFWLAKWLREAGFFMSVYSPESGPLLECYRDCGIPVIVDPLIRTAPQSLRSRAETYDLIVPNTILGAGLVHLAQQWNKPSIWFVHEGQFGRDITDSDPDVRSALALADVVIFPCHATAARYRQFATGTNHRVIRYGIPDEARQTLPILPPTCGAKLRLLHLGSVEPRKGQEILLEALRLVPQDTARRLEIHFVGRVLSTSKIPPYALSLIKNGKLGDNVYYHGEVPPQTAKRYLQSADLLVSTARDEALPITILEAMAYGKAVIATPAGGIPEIIDPGTNGILIPMEDPRALADALTYLTNDLEDVHSFGAAGRRMFEKQFTMGRYGLDVANVLREFLPGNREVLPFVPYQPKRRAA